MVLWVDGGDSAAFTWPPACVCAADRLIKGWTQLRRLKQPTAWYLRVKVPSGESESENFKASLGLDFVTTSAAVLPPSPSKSQV